MTAREGTRFQTSTTNKTRAHTYTHTKNIPLIDVHEGR